VQGLFTGAVSKAETTNAPPTPPHVDIAPAAPPTSSQLAWDSTMKETDTQPGDTQAKFFFSVTNISTSDAIIERVQTSCGCTVAKLPSQPWVLKPQEDGKINVSVNLMGKSGTIFKMIHVFFTNGPAKDLTVKVVMPENPEMQRARNQQLALVDREKVFKDPDCIHCHLDPTRGKAGKDLFVAACGICHESEHRATMVPNLHALNHSTDKIYWKQWITTGKPGSLMPGFGTEVGGPLTPEQIDSLVEYLWVTIPHDPQTTPGKTSAAAAGL
jgi:mono/diheme cytochrome c family protein